MRHVRNPCSASGIRYGDLRVLAYGGGSSIPERTHIMMDRIIPRLLVCACACGLAQGTELYSDNFDSTVDLSDWTEGGAADWSLDLGGLASNDGGVGNLYLKGGASWTDYEVTCTVTLNDDDGVGFIVRQTSESQMVVLYINGSSKAAEVLEFDGDPINYGSNLRETRTLASDPWNYVPGTTYAATVTVEGQSVSLVLDDADGVADPVTVFDQVALTAGANTAGTFGLLNQYMTKNNYGFVVDDLVISDGAAGPMPLDLSAVALSHESVALSWPDAGSTETIYRVSQLADDGSTWNEIGTVDDDNSATYSYQVTGLEASTAYEFKVDAE